jgi:tetratricopeptide (TPR) repeat protein
MFGLTPAALVPAHADNAIDQDCFAADPRYSIEACNWALHTGGDRSPDDVFRMNAALGNAELAAGKADYALLDFQTAIDAAEKGGATPAADQYADVLALAAIAHLVEHDPSAALETLDRAAAKDATNSRLPLLRAHAHFASGDAVTAVGDLDGMIAARPADQSLVALKTMFTHWQLDPAAGVAECQKAYAAECGAGALALHETDKAATDLVSSIIAAIFQASLPRMSRVDAPGAWSDCEAPEPQYAVIGCQQLLSGVLTPEERYVAEVNSIAATIRNGDPGTAAGDARQLVGRLEYGAAKAPEDDIAGVRAHALLVQAYLAQERIDEASEAADDALADSPSEQAYLALRALVDLAQDDVDDADTEMRLAVDAAGNDASDLANLAAVIADMNEDLATGIEHCSQVYAGATCGADAYAADNRAAALLKAATDINAVFLGDAERPYTLIGRDTLP